MATSGQSAGAQRIGIVVAHFNEPVTSRLLEGARSTLAQALPAASCDVCWVPGCFELAQQCAQLARGGGYDGLLALGCLIKGGTDHYEFLAASTAGALADLSARIEVPLAFGVLTCRSVALAQARAGGDHGNKGSEAAEALVWMLGLRAGADLATILSGLQQRGSGGGGHHHE